MNKWIIYQKERCPLLSYVFMSIILGACSLIYSRHLPVTLKTVQHPGVFQYAVSIISTLTFFMLLIIGDEHKDYEKYRKYYPNRPVQRGLVTLRELRRVGSFLIAVQVILAILLDPNLLGLLAIVYIWYILMFIRFFVPDLLRGKPTLYLVSHMLIVPMMMLYATAIEWLPRLGTISFGIIMFIISIFCSGMIVEIGAKLIREEDDISYEDTYTKIWGTKRTIKIWMTSLVLSYISTIAAAYPVKAAPEIITVLSAMMCLAIFYCIRFLKNPCTKTGKIFRIFPRVWNVTLYLLLGIVPFFKVN